MGGIIQDSSDDWVVESSQMASVYRGGVLNIAATGFSNGQNGLFVERKPNLEIPIIVSATRSSARRAAVASSVWISGKKASQTHHSVDEAGRCRSELYLSEQFTLVHGNCFGNAYVSSRQKCIQKVCSMIGFPVPNSYLCPERAPNKNEQSAFAVFANSYFCRKAVAKTIMGAKERANQEKTKGQENSDATTREKLLGQVLTRRMCR